MGFSVYLKPEFLGKDFTDEQRADVLLNSLNVQAIQFIMIICIWHFAITFDQFYVRPVDNIYMMVARFVASMFMHINVEKDVRAGINMMKYSLNHYKNFTNPYPPFFLGLIATILSVIVEINVMLILSNMTDCLNVINKYVSLSAVANIPRFYYASLVEHKMTCCKDLKIQVTKFRH